ncbi:MAG TPA: M23 family metallopeptidase, partial [Nannocystis sp.]
MTKLSCLRVFAMMLASGVAISACDDEFSAEELSDPASLLGDDLWWDEGPPAGEQSIEQVGEITAELDPTLAPAFQLPFPCNQVWAGQTRTDHSPQNSVDFNRTNDVDDPVVASAAGKVSRVANEGATSYGRWVEIDHGSGYRSRYAHLNSQTVSVGQSVTRGQKIGTVGSTGGSSGPHLHYEVRLNGTAIKPVFNGSTALFFGTKNYTSNNCGGGGGGASFPGTVNTNGIALTIRSTPSTSGTA